MRDGLHKKCYGHPGRRTGRCGLGKNKTEIGPYGNISVSKGRDVHHHNGRPIVDYDQFGPKISPIRKCWGLAARVWLHIFIRPQDRDIKVGIEYEAGMAEIINFKEDNEGLIVDTTRTWHGGTTGSICRDPDGYHYQADQAAAVTTRRPPGDRKVTPISMVIHFFSSKARKACPSPYR